MASKARVGGGAGGAGGTEAGDGDGNTAEAFVDLLAPSSHADELLRELRSRVSVPLSRCFFKELHSVFLPHRAESSSGAEAAPIHVVRTTLNDAEGGGVTAGIGVAVKRSRASEAEARGAGSERSSWALHYIGQVERRTSTSAGMGGAKGGRSGAKKAVSAFVRKHSVCRVDESAIHFVRALGYRHEASFVCHGFAVRLADGTCVRAYRAGQLRRPSDAGAVQFQQVVPPDYARESIPLPEGAPVVTVASRFAVHAAVKDQAESRGWLVRVFKVVGNDGVEPAAQAVRNVAESLKGSTREISEEVFDDVWSVPQPVKRAAATKSQEDLFADSRRRFEQGTGQSAAPQ